MYTLELDSPIIAVHHPLITTTPTLGTGKARSAFTWLVTLSENSKTRHSLPVSLWFGIVIMVLSLCHYA